MDNAASYYSLLPTLVDQGYEVFALDFVGHGKSDHLSEGEYVFGLHIITVYYVIDILEWNNFILIGHSMGGAIATIVAAAFPEFVEKLILFEALGPFSLSKDIHSADFLNLTAKGRSNLFKRTPKVHKTIEDALKHYRKKNPELAEHTTRALTRRGLIKVKGGFIFGHDSKLVGLGRVLREFTHNETLKYIDRIRCPTLLIFTKYTLEKWEKPLFGNPEPQIVYLNEKIARFGDGILTYVLLEEGGHHVHSDLPDLVMEHVNAFLHESPRL
eukprot:TRINITY_DN3384_c0_g1_i2.p1 TRINITY_DN3384_c0_g1~~TRINITY_DN3384_c0_g1_i2.p1  ORF type:complete len:271 (-),score=48.48 TRINITY_DN3384_c0_g1_i2:48-860(-)